jgi:hypothetical protein
MRIEPPVISSSQHATNTKAMMMMLKRFFSDGI